MAVQSRFELPFVRMGLESIQLPKPFQAEREGSIPTRPPEELFTAPVFGVFQATRAERIEWSVSGFR